MNWRDIPSLDGLYQVSSCGQVRSVDRAVRGRPGRRDWFKRGRVLRQTISPNGYLRARVSVDGDDRTLNVHRLVALAWIGKPPVDATVNHKDGDKKNNQVSNLEWLSCAANIRHAIQSGLKRVARAGNPNAKLTEADVTSIRGSEESRPVLAEKYGVSACQITRVRRGHQWQEASRRRGNI